MGYLIICRVSTKDNACSSTDGCKTLAKNIPEFQKKGKLGFHFKRISSANSDLLSIVTTNKAVYHHNYFSNCCWCSKKDIDANLVPAWTYRAIKLTTKSDHVKDLTAAWTEIATKLNHKAVYGS